MWLGRCRLAILHDLQLLRAANNCAPVAFAITACRTMLRLLSCATQRSLFQAELSSCTRVPTSVATTHVGERSPAPCFVKTRVTPVHSRTSTGAPRLDSTALCPAETTRISSSCAVRRDHCPHLSCIIRCGEHGGAHANARSLLYACTPDCLLVVSSSSSTLSRSFHLP
jgi:hypothetical protein